MGDKEALRAESILHDRVAAYRWKLRLVRQTCKDTLDDGEALPEELRETLKYIRDHLAKEPDDG